MKVLIDTPIWSLALRRRRHLVPAPQQALITEFENLVREGSAVLVGPVLQEILSGISDAAYFEKLRLLLRGFKIEPLAAHDFEEAARCSNTCRLAGIAGSLVDFLLCAVAIGRDMAVFTLDRDFDQYSSCLPLRLYTSEMA